MTDDLKWYLLTQKKAERNILAAFQALRSEAIEPILIKGWAAARNYPETVPRFFGDTDLAVSAADYEKAKSLVQTHPSLRGVDLHRELRHLDTLDWDRLFSNSKLVDIDAEQVRILAPEDHLRVMCVHWLTNGGEHRDRLFDIVYAVENRPANFDWSKCLDVVSPARRSWIVCTIGLAHKYLDLSLDGLPFASEAREIPNWLTKSVERSWTSDSRLRGIDESITDRKAFLRQVRNRLPPNPIQSTVFCEGRFDDRPRIGYQMRDMVGRIIPSIKRLWNAVIDQYQWSRTK